VVTLDNVKGAAVEGLSVTAAGNSWTAAVRVADSVVPGDEGAAIKDVKIDPAEAMAPVQDERR
jgi:hypothetical protein